MKKSFVNIFLERSNSDKRHLNAFTLTEVMVVLVIIGILVLIALPTYTNFIGSAHATEAKIQLNSLAKAQKFYYDQNFKYTDNIGEIFQPPKTIAEGGTSKYRYEIVNASTVGYLARATAIHDFDNDGQFNIWEVTENGQVIQIMSD